MKSPITKRSIVVAGHKTSVSLEDAFWRALKEIAGARHTTLCDLVAAIDTAREQGNLSSAIRLFVLDFHRRQLADLKEEHTHQLADLKEGHGGTHQRVEHSVPA
jgi:predicted DNA-binding ribbon-helix-helix protein